MRALGGATKPSFSCHLTRVLLVSCVTVKAGAWPLVAWGFVDRAKQQGPRFQLRGQLNATNRYGGVTAARASPPGLERAVALSPSPVPQGSGQLGIFWPGAIPSHPPHILASTDIPEANVTKVKLKCFVIVSFIFLCFFTLLN